MQLRDSNPVAEESAGSPLVYLATAEALITFSSHCRRGGPSYQ